MVEHLPSQFKGPGSTPLPCCTIGEKREKEKKGRGSAMKARSPPHQAEHVVRLVVIRVGRDEIWKSLASHSLLQQFLGII